MPVRQSIEIAAEQLRCPRAKDKEASSTGSGTRRKTQGRMNIELPTGDEMVEDEHHEHATMMESRENGEPPSLDNCEKNHDPLDATITISSTSKQAGKTVAPFLAKHIPEQYAPMGILPRPADSQRDQNTKYCYRHRPDSKCRRTADEPTMEILQRVCGVVVGERGCLVKDTDCM